MKLLLDTHIVLAVVNDALDELPNGHSAVLQSQQSYLYCSTASLWEIAIKSRLGRLRLACDLTDLAAICRAFNLNVMAIAPEHVLHDVSPQPSTRDPFDRLLLAQAACEQMRLVTLDDSLRTHPLAWTD
ncbi:MAG: type II toxin-antitoxin system VapC family toxin [Hyphomicrobiaceae bacterium]|nr:type II toxin-antitoxin system VapC family toxin [Hyphomicrobiaceae bacterium]